MTVLVTVNGSHAHFRWWWPTGWMFIPAGIVAVGLIMAVVPLRHRDDADEEVAPTSDRQEMTSSAGGFILGRNARMKARNIVVLATPPDVDVRVMAPMPTSAVPSQGDRTVPAGIATPPDAATRSSGELPRVRDLSLTKVGVHRAGVWAAGDPLSGLAADPADQAAEYVLRRHDAQFRRQLADAAARGSGLVWLVGRSCTGKTRSAWEARC